MDHFDSVTHSTISISFRIIRVNKKQFHGSINHAQLSKKAKFRLQKKAHCKLRKMWDPKLTNFYKERLHSTYAFDVWGPYFRD